MGKFPCVVGLAILLLSSFAAQACPQGYESQISLVQSARLILGVKVKAVRDVMPRKDQKQGFHSDSDDKRGVHAQARVEVTELVRGSCHVKDFDLIGGPYDSCAPMPCFIPFEPDESYFLILDRPLPDDTKSVTITWRCRVFSGSKADLVDLMKRADQQRLRMMELHARLFPNAMATAKELSTGEVSEETVNNATYPVLACLRLLWCDPDHFRTSETNPENLEISHDPLSPPTTEPPKERMRGAVLTAHNTSPWQSRNLDMAMTARAGTQPAETKDYHRRLLIAYITSETGIDEATATKIVNDESTDHLLSLVQESPLRLDLDLQSLIRNGKSTPSRLLQSASFLLVLADEADDRMVWRGFAFGTNQSPRLDPELFLPMLERHPERFSQSWGGISLLLSMPDPRCVSAVKKLMLECENDSRLESFFNYFAKLHNEAACLETLDRFGTEIAKRIAQDKNPENRKRALEFAGYLVSECSKSAKTHDLKSADVDARLKHLSELYPKAKNSDNPF